MASSSIKKMLEGLDLFTNLNRQSLDADAADSLPSPDSPTFNPSTISLQSDTPTIEESLPPSPRYGLPPNFAEVAPGIFRSSFPQSTNFEHLADLNLKTILTLVSEEYSEDYVEFIKSQGIQHHQIMIPPNKEAFTAIPLEAMTKALSLISDTRNHPILVHCNKGKHRTGCVIGCYRKMCDWELDHVTTEYRNYAGTKARPLDEKYIADFDEKAMVVHLNEVAFNQAKEHKPLLTPPASERS